MIDIESATYELTGALSIIRDVARRLARTGAEVDPISGAVCLSHRPRIAPQAYAFRLFPGASHAMMDSYQEIHGLTIPEPYRQLLLKLNGANLYQLDLFGVPPSMAAFPPLLDRSTVWPLDIGTAQTDWRFKYSPPAGSCFIGYSPFNPEENMGHFMLESGEIETFRRGGFSVGRWGSIEEFLASELPKAELEYLSYEDRMAAMMIGTGANAKRYHQPRKRKQ